MREFWNVYDANGNFIWDVERESGETLEFIRDIYFPGVVRDYGLKVSYPVTIDLEECLR